jgi:parallel beta-helix repeat protein
MNMNKKVVLVCVFVCLVSLVVVQGGQSQSTGAVFINADGSVSGTSKIQRDGTLYRLNGNLESPIVVLCNSIVLDGEGFVLQGTGGWGIPGVAGAVTTPAINLTCSNVTVRNFNILGWEAGVLGAYNGNTISNNNITETERAIAIYADNYNLTGNYLASSIDGIRIKGNNNRISQNQLVNNYDGIMISSSSGTVITENNFVNNSTAVNVDSSIFEINHNNFINKANAGIVTTTSDAIGFGGGIMPTWDNGEEGNYWSDYTTKYPNATEIDHTGIGDTPYLIRVNPTVTDRYPLITSVNVQNITLPSPSIIPSQTQTPSSSPTSASSPTAPPSSASSPSPSPSPTANPTPSSPSPTPTPSATEQPTQSPQPQPTTPPAELLAAVVATATIIIALVAVALKKRQQPSNSRI